MTDFGIAAVAGPVTGCRAPSWHRRLHVAEQARGEGELEPASDLYSLVWSPSSSQGGGR